MTPRPGGGRRRGRRAVAGLALVFASALLACGDGGEAGGGMSSTKTAGEISGAGSARDLIARPGGAGEWATYGGDHGQTRYSPLRRIRRGNVDSLRRAWSYETGVAAVFEATPLAVGGALYVSTPMASGVQEVHKLDAAGGELLWRTRIELDRPRPHPTPANRGVAVGGGRVYLGTLDARVVALDTADGSMVWQRRTASPAEGYNHKQAPLYHDGRLYIGVSGGPLGIRGFVKALDAATGDELWTWHSIPSPEQGGWWGPWTDTLPGTEVPLPRDLARERADSARHADAWRRGGGGVWMTPSLDPDRGLLYVGVGNPAPELTARTRPGDNRWTVSVCALRVRDGRTEWCDQYLPHDLWGLDAASPPFLFPLPGSEGRPAVGHFSKLGVFYAWDRRSGERLTMSDSYVPRRNFLARPGREGVVMAPGIYGGTEWSPGAYSPRTGLVYAANVHAPGRYFVRESGGRRGTVGFDLLPPGRRHGNLVALDPGTGEVVWKDRTPMPMVGGVLATAGDLVFSGRLSGSLDAWDARTGEHLWRGRTEAGCASAPMTYLAGGRQYVAITCGGHFLGGGKGDQVAAFALPRVSGGERSGR